MLNTQDGYRHSIPLEIRFADIDSLGHVNNATYLTYMEQARLIYVRDVGVWDVRPGGLGLILVKATVEFKLPLVMSDEIRVYTRTNRLGNKSFDTEQIIMRHDGQIAALGFITIVVYDYNASASAPIPDSWRARLIDYEPALKAT
jgi:acyl-CoA thioester hydrolase